ncbi:MAG: ABC transporter permease, partial [Planctomycetota bacterium]
MAAYFVRRLLLMIPTFIGVTLIAFMITRVVPGGPLERELMRIRMGAAEAAGGRVGAVGQIPESALRELKRAFDLDKPAHVAYFLWMKRVLTLDLGRSYSFREPVWNLIKERFPVSIYFGLIGFVLAYLVCIPLGVFKALRHGSPFDVASSAIVFVGYSIPGWALGALLLVLFAGGQFFTWFPLGGFRSDSYDS